MTFLGSASKLFALPQSIIYRGVALTFDLEPEDGASALLRLPVHDAVALRHHQGASRRRRRQQGVVLERDALVTPAAHTGSGAGRALWWRGAQQEPRPTGGAGRAELQELDGDVDFCSDPADINSVDVTPKSATGGATVVRSRGCGRPVKDISPPEPPLI